MVDNFELFKKYYINEISIAPLPKDDMYFVIELIRRGKDHPDLPAANYHFKNYYIRSIDDFNKYENEIKEVCDLLKLRAYISVTIKSFKQVALNTSAELVRRIANGDFKKSYIVYDSCSAKYRNKFMKRYVVDIDDVSKIDLIKNVIDNIKPFNEQKIILEVPTKSGMHLITKPFDILHFNQKLIESKEFDKHTLPEIKKNHISLLYENI